MTVITRPFSGHLTFNRDDIDWEQVSPMRCGEREVMVFPGFKAGSIQLVSE